MLLLLLSRSQLCVLVLLFTPRKRKLPKQQKKIAQLKGDGGGVREQQLGRQEDCRDLSYKQQQTEKKKLQRNFQLGLVFIFLAFTQCFGFGQRFCFILNLFFQWNPWDFSEIDCWTETYRHQSIRKSFGLFVGHFFEDLGSCGT